MLVSSHDDVRLSDEWRPGRAGTAWNRARPGGDRVAEKVCQAPTTDASRTATTCPAGLTGNGLTPGFERRIPAPRISPNDLLRGEGIRRANGN
ncbi:hypothetical protein FRAHR75_390048 [Frankia sp. Hr75.2]|nr:hypothetical protein FRAHR75_390048 [Frankia sp. Hr75.2]